MVKQERALSGVRVLDLTHYIAGPYCTKMLSDYGADVVKVERPGLGDAARSLGPFLNDEPHPEKSGLFLYLNTNKKSITLNLKSATGVSILKELVKQSDILVENFSPRVMPSLGLDYKTLKKINPGLVMTSISNFGQTGPYRDYKATDLNIWGLSGILYECGEPNREPLKMGNNVSEYVAGLYAALTTLSALYYRDEGRRGATHRCPDVGMLSHHAAVDDAGVFLCRVHQEEGGGAFSLGHSPLQGRFYRVLPAHSGSLGIAVRPYGDARAEGEARI